MRKGDYCISHIENMRDNNCITDKRYRELKEWGVFREGYSEVSELSEAACTPLMRETDPEIKAKAIEAVGENISHGNIPTARQVKTILENKRAGVASGGRIQRERESPPNQHTLVIKDFLLPEQKDKVEDVEDPGIDAQQDYYIGDTPQTPDEPENQNDSDPSAIPLEIREQKTEKRDIVVPTDVSDIVIKEEEERVVQTVTDIQKAKEDERERNGIAEKNKNKKNRDELVFVLTDAMRRALHEGITRKDVFEALHIAIESVFEPIETEDEEKKRGSDLISGGVFK